MIVNKYKVISITYDTSSTKSFFRIGSEGSEYMALDSKKNLRDLYKKNAVSNVDLSKLKKVYFDSACTFPRFKLSQFTDVKRCLKVEKADAIIITIPSFDNHWYSEFIALYSASADQVYLMREYEIDNTRTQKVFNKTKVTATDVVNHLINQGMIESDCTLIFQGNPIKLSEDSYKSLKNMDNLSTKPFIIDSDLDKAISDTQETPDTSDLDSVKEFLASSDSATVELGMKLLLNYNVLQKACTVGLLILRYSRNICNTNAVNSVGFKNLLGSLNLTKNDLSYFGESDIPRYLKKLYEITTDQGDKDNARQMVIDILSDSMKQRFDSYGDIVKVLDIKSEIKLY